MDHNAIKQAAEAYLPDMTRFLRDLIAIPSESCEEEGVIRRTIAEMEALGFDKAEIDPEGNALGWMGEGSRIIAFDGHIDTVGVGNTYQNVTISGMDADGNDATNPVSYMVFETIGRLKLHDPIWSGVNLTRHPWSRVAFAFSTFFCLLKV